MSEEYNLREINITDAWHKNIFMSLVNLQELEKICRDGARNITEYLEVNPFRIPEIQLQHLKMMITETNILLMNVNQKLENKIVLNLKKVLKLIKKNVYIKRNIIYYKKTQESLWAKKIDHVYLTSNYYYYLEKLCEIREEIVLKLTPTLFGVEEENMNKIKKGEIIK